MSTNTTVRPVDAAIGKRVHAAMCRRTRLQIEFAEALGMSQSTLSRKLTGERGFTAAQLVAAAHLLDVAVVELLPEPADHEVAP